MGIVFCYMAYKHLKTQQEYEDQYDKFTVHYFRDLEKIFLSEPPKEDFIDSKGRKLPPELYRGMSKVIFDVSLCFRIGQKYIEKKETVRKWMEDDIKKDELLENSEAPSLIRCRKCLGHMNFKNKYLLAATDDKVVFFFECPNKCLPHRLVYQDGTDWVRDPDLCPKCKGVMESSDNRNENVITTAYGCGSCGHKYSDELVLSTEEKLDPDFEKDKARFCMSEEEGQRYIIGSSGLKTATDSILKMEEKRKDKKFYDEINNLTKLTIPQLKEYLINLLKEKVYSNLIFEQPQMERIVSVGFSIEDPTNQSEYESRQKLSKIIKKGLENTNCRLMSDGIDYRLGILTGRLRIYEKEEDLVELIKKASLG